MIVDEMKPTTSKPVKPAEASEDKTKEQSLKEETSKEPQSAEEQSGQGQPAQPSAPASVLEKAETTSIGQKSVGKILLVEDDLPMVKMYSTKLKKEGFIVEVAYNGEEGLEKIKSLNPDLVVLDLMIPKIGGMDLLEQLRADPKTRELPIIILSNLSQEQDIQRSKELGVKEFLVKANFTPGQVAEKIAAVLRK